MSEGIIEMGANIPVYVDELSMIKTIGAVTHLIFTYRQPEASREDKIERVVQLRLMVPTDQLDTMAKAMLAREALVRVHGEFGVPLSH